MDYCSSEVARVQTGEGVEGGSAPAPQYRTMPMVWYVPPLSPIGDLLKGRATMQRTATTCSALLSLSVFRLSAWLGWLPLVTLGLLLTFCALLAAMRSYMRDINLGGEGSEEIAQAVGMTGQQVYEMYRLMAIAKYNERYVIPKAHMEDAHNLEEMGCSLSVDGGPGMYGDAFNDMEGPLRPRVYRCLRG